MPVSNIASGLFSFVFPVRCLAGVGQFHGQQQKELRQWPLVPLSRNQYIVAQCPLDIATCLQLLKTLWSYLTNNREIHYSAFIGLPKIVDCYSILLPVCFPLDAYSNKIVPLGNSLRH